MKLIFKKIPIMQFMVLSAVFSALVACVSLIPDAQMNKMGADAFNELKSKTPRETNPVINNYVLCIAKALLKVTPEDPNIKEWEVVVFRDQTVNAFALPGGKIGIHTGIFSVTKNADQLATVIGHEIAHVVKKHGSQRATQNMGAKGVLNVTGMVLGNSPLKETAMGVLGVGAQYGMILPFSRVHENEADALGVELMAKAGFDPAQAVVLWENMSSLGGNKPPEFASTHPSDATRIKNLRSLVDSPATKANIYYQAALKENGHPNCKM